MPAITLQIPQANQPNSTEDAKIASDFTSLQNLLNGGLDTANLASSAGIVLSQVAFITRGNAAVTWSGTSQYGGATVNHGFSVAPASVIATSTVAPGSFYVVTNVSVNATQITFSLYAPQGNPGAGSSTVYWTAVL